MKIFLTIAFLVFVLILGCKNPTASESQSVIGDGSKTLPSLPGTDPAPTPPVISGTLSLTTDDSTKELARTVDWSGVTYTSETSNARFEIAIGFDDDSDGFDAEDQNNLLDWTEPSNSLTATDYQVADGIHGLALSLSSETNYFYSIRAIDQDNLASNVVSSSAWQTLSVPMWFNNNANWLDASDTSSLFQDAACSIAATANSDPIKCWQDKSGSSTDALDSVAAGDPINLSPGLNGLNLIDFNGAEGLLMASSAAFTSAVGYTLFVVMLHDGNTANQTVYRGRPNGAFGTQSGLSFEMINSLYTNTIYEDTNNDSLGFSSIGAIGTTPIIHRLDFSSGGTPFEIFQNGSTIGLAPNTGANGNPGGVVTNSTVAVGYNAWDNGRNLRGQIAEIILYTVDLGTTEKEIVEGYLACKWGQQASLPGAHTYASNCP